ncbi:MAG TPA: amidohydrolase family protein [Thermoanaerobaculia bacterium]|nr:amidohydrolase family protein [Thermoanaerobaculia bacterium]
MDGTVVVADGKIVAVGPRGSVVVPAGARVVDCKGLVVTAGFQNSHVHFTEAKWAGAGAQPAPALAGYLAAMLTRYGFTTVVDTASSLDNTSALRRRIESGEVAGPRIFTAGEGIYPPDGIPYYLKTTLPAEVLRQLPQPVTPQQAVEVVAAHVRGGADITKLFTGSWVKRGTVLPMPEEIAAAAAAEAHRHGKLVFSHPSNLTGLEVAIRAHVDVLAHVLDDARGLTPEHLKRMKAQDMAVIPTLKLFGRPPYLFELLDEVRDYFHLGGQILFGTDVGYLPDYDPTAEYEGMESAGLGWRDILATLTTAPAQRFGEASRRGRIAAGMDADLVMLAGDPAAGPRGFVDVRYTIRGGRVIFTAP